MQLLGQQLQISHGLALDEHAVDSSESVCQKSNFTKTRVHGKRLVNKEGKSRDPVDVCTCVATWPAPCYHKAILLPPDGRPIPGPNNLRDEPPGPLPVIVKKGQVCTGNE